MSMRLNTIRSSEKACHRVRYRISNTTYALTLKDHPEADHVSGWSLTSSLFISQEPQLQLVLRIEHHIGSQQNRKEYIEVLRNKNRQHDGYLVSDGFNGNRASQDLSGHHARQGNKADGSHGCDSWIDGHEHRFLEIGQCRLEPGCTECKVIVVDLLVLLDSPIIGRDANDIAIQAVTQYHPSDGDDVFRLKQTVDSDYCAVENRTMSRSGISSDRRSVRSHLSASEASS